MKLRVVAGALIIGCMISSRAESRDFGVLWQPIHQGKWTSSLLYEHLKVTEDFDMRGDADFSAQAVGPQFTYGITDTLALGVKGAALIDPQEEAQGTTWRGRSGFLYGIDLYNEVFPATEYRPGVQVSAGVSGFQAQFNSQSGAAAPIDQVMTGVDYHTSVLLSLKVWRAQPYTGLRAFGRSVNWNDNNSAADGGPARIVGHAHGNASAVLGLPIQITPQIRFQIESLLINETTVTAGFTIIGL